MIWIILAGLTILSGLLYRMGGAGDEGRKAFPWLPSWAFNTKARDVGCALCCTAGMFTILIGFMFPWWAHLLAFLFLFGALTTYWDFLFGWDNHWMHGFMCALAYFPYAIVSGMWISFGVRCIACAILMGLISGLSGNDNVEEIGRGSLLVLTLPLMLI